MDSKTLKLLDQIAASIRKAGFEPYDQITGYLRTGNDRYITRTGDARELIQGIDRKDLKQYAAYLKAEK